ncbi:autotransporter assembly complex family protein [Salicola sp. Rm-C-2C1-2]|uniref:autotransporter assembly complex protein TamA n=1 Tax=Salicola sp. Rm-C-2C1-2 TaxID=3141321 RepID=UPI0032E44792
MMIPNVFRLFLFPLLLLAISGVRAAELEVIVDPENDALQSNIRAHVGDLGRRNAASLRRFASHARDSAREAMRALGYYQGEVQYRVVEARNPVLRLQVTPGEPVRLVSVRIEVRGEASQLPSFQLPERLRPETGDVLNHGRYEQVKRFFRGRAQTHGFFDGQFVTSELRVRPADREAEIRLLYDSGPRYSLGEAAFPDDSYFEQDLLARFVRFEAGAPYHSDRLIELTQDLRGAGYFSEVRLDADPEAAEKRDIPVKVSLDERTRHSLGTGVGFSTDVGPRLRATWDEHYVNPQGHSRGAEFEVSQPRQNAGIYYELPLNPPMTDALRFTGSLQNEDIEDTRSRRISLGAQWQSQLESGWQQVVSLRREEDRFTVGDETERTRLVLPGLSYSYLKRDSPVDPSRGYRLQFESSGGQRDMFSDIDVIHLVASAQGLITVGEAGHRFLTRVRAGGIGTNDFGQVPPFLRFFAGGDQSVRGYGYRTLGPTDEDGDNVGGRFLLTGSLEYQYPLSKSWRLAAFVDEGNAFDTLGDPLKTGVGVGIRWVSPVGPIRLDVARGLDEPENFRLHFSMGPEL